MIAATTAAAGASGMPRTSSAATGVDFDSFLRLLTAQLRHQDPLSPIDSTQFVAQLASFSTVEQLVGANDRLDALAAMLQGDSLARYAPWIGREAEVAGALFRYDGAPVGFRAPLNGAADRAEAVISDRYGREIARYDVPLDGERLDFSAPSPGEYAIAIAYYRDGRLIASAPAGVFGVVREVRLENGATVLGFTNGMNAAPEQVTGLADRAL